MVQPLEDDILLGLPRGAKSLRLCLTLCDEGNADGVQWWSRWARLRGLESLCSLLLPLLCYTESQLSAIKCPQRTVKLNMLEVLCYFLLFLICSINSCPKWREEKVAVSDDEFSVRGLYWTCQTFIDKNQQHHIMDNSLLLFFLSLSRTLCSIKRIVCQSPAILEIWD